MNFRTQYLPTSYLDATPRRPHVSHVIHVMALLRKAEDLLLYDAWNGERRVQRAQLARVANALRQIHDQLAELAEPAA